MEKRRVSVEEGYRRWAPTYGSDPNPLLALEQRQLEYLLPDMTGKRVLDLGCGGGRWLARVQAGGPRIAVGLDASGAMLKEARENAGGEARLVRGDMLHLPFQSGVFNLVLCSFAIGHVQNLSRLCSEAARVSAPNAEVLVSDVHPDAYHAGWRTGFRDRDGAFEIETWFRATRDMLAPWTENGFECLRVVECRFGEPERQVFERAGKSSVFDEFCRVPAVLICHFQRSSGPRVISGWARGSQINRHG